MIRFAKISQEILLTLGAILGAICILATLSAVFFGVTPLIFRSGSMSPAISTGALALAQSVPGSDIHVGDVVSAINPQGTRVTHRVEGVAQVGGSSYALTMRGDANKVADPEDYIVTSAYRVIWHLDGLGFVIQEVQKPPYVFALGALAGALVIFSVRTRRAARQAEPESPEAPDERGDDEPTDPPEPDGLRIFAPADVDASAQTPAARPAAGLVVKTSALVLVPLALLGGLFAVHPTDTQAAFTDQAGATSAALASSLGTTFQPTAVTCAGTGTGSKDMTVTWSLATNTPNAGYTISGGPTTNPTQTTSAGKITVVFPEVSVVLNSYTMTVSAKHFTNWPASAAPFTATINNSNRKVNC